MWGSVEHVRVATGALCTWNRGFSYDAALREIIANSAAEGDEWNAQSLSFKVEDWQMSPGPLCEHVTGVDTWRKVLIAHDNGRGIRFRDSKRLATLGTETNRHKRFGLNNMGFQQAAATLSEAVFVASRTQLPDGTLTRTTVRCVKALVDLGLTAGDFEEWIGLYGYPSLVKDLDSLPVFAKFLLSKGDERSSIAAWTRDFEKANKPVMGPAM